jgi:biopolymer transport protein ExbD
MSGSLATAANAEPNLTPMLDMVFQLVTFFMLVINFKTASMDLSLKLPVVGSARAVGGPQQKELVVLNIDSHGVLRVFGVEQRDIEGYIRKEAESSLYDLNKAEGTSLHYGDELPSIVVIRADKATPFKLLNRLIKACQDSGFRNFALKALNKEPGT